MRFRLSACFVPLAAIAWLLTAAAVAEETLSTRFSTVWRQTGVLPAAEAVQAAAADERFFYAVNNTLIAKYNRQTGERIAISTGEARHLNSGFLHGGRLYCAHSNYPLMPERSEIKVMDLDSMRLSTFKDFGNYGGSLTWAVHHEGDWWCNFARYGANNRETFLVRFDDRWQEKSRWTYPEGLIGKLGRYSLSGGVWRDCELLVTGHDDPVLFRLRLPTAGSVLELIDQQPAPFSGQGIAHDPATGGLVGIQRATRQVVFAQREETFERGPVRVRVLSYNIHHGEGIDGRLDLERIARIIRSVEPDLVSLQEVDKNARRSGSADQAAELARLTKMQVVFGANIPLQGGQYGNAVLSRFPVRRHENHKLPNFDMGEQRGVLEVEFDLPGADTQILFFATHLDHRRPDAERLASAKAINERILRQPDRPAILVGDLNAVPDSAVLKEFLKQWTVTNDHPLPTIPVREPARQIDYILFRPGSRWRAIATKVLDEAVASDHRAIFSVLELLPSAREPEGDQK
jgi:endonuclease/exonuclease/phosphatase family metal-dependent hydrolase